MPSQHHVHHRVGEWLPKDQRVLEDWFSKKIEKAKARNRSPSDWDPVIQEFKRLIETDPDIYMDFHQMFEQVPEKPPYKKDPEGKWQVRDYLHMLELFDLIITEAPSFEQGDAHVGVPINAILDWPMGTPAGFRAFLNPKVNKMFHKMFDVWAAFLSSPDSRYVLTTDDHGWFGPTASASIPNFAETFVCDPSAPYHGFKSWDDFFTRRFRPGVRPIQFPDDDRIIDSACESRVYKIASNIKALDKFWIKGEPYSLNHILDNDAYAPQFVGGTIYQAFLSALNYHRWASPVNGTITKVVNVPGTYFAESPEKGFLSQEGPDPDGPNASQGFLTSVATRALIFIQADNPNIGLMCLVAVGMGDVSTCEVTAKAGDAVRKGDEIGSFHFGGSTYCMLFRPQTKVTFNADYPVGTMVPLNAAIATIAQ